MSSSRKEYYASRDASKVYLLGSFPRWRAFKEQHKLRTDKDVADMLLDSYLAMNRIVCNAETQTETVMESRDMPPSTPSKYFSSPIKTSTPNAHSNPRPLSALSDVRTSYSIRSGQSVISDSRTLTAKDDSSDDESDDDNDSFGEHTIQADQVLSDDSLDVCPPGFDVPLLDDLLNVTIRGHDGDEPTEDVGTQQQQQQQHKTIQPEYISTVEEVSPEDAIKKEKCIVFTDTLIALITSLMGVFVNNKDVAVC
ncbi:uncharacterized protein LOC114544945 [Dendronephthya gigantea]|uniref:uncharacterized protein LOC114544456 n=1 Tax=Dendronephthya gigantea TaxID=151771 RepID=UPI00106CA2C3|nr:uncharacterized protein LOC114544456 [Dendronephthya gigantea]XP_028419218.1 uncharacterized protein LOC114544945 [Dendronephthya gigantea]